MMVFQIRGIPPYDGEYTLNGGLKADELRLIKRVSGVRGGEIEAALEAGDYDVVVALAMIAVQRARPDDRVRQEPFDKSEIGAIDVVGDEADDALPPANESDGAGTPKPSGSHSKTDSEIGTTPSSFGPRSSELPASRRPLQSAG